METGSYLAQRVMNGDSEAFGLLVKMYREEIYAIALGIAANSADAEDLTQEIFIKAYLNLTQLREPGKFDAWLRRIARNHCRDWLRTRAQQHLPIDDLFAEDQLTFPPADEGIINEDFGRALATALSSLKAKDEQILRLFYIYGFRYDEITRVTGLSYSAAANRLHKAKKRMKALIDGYIPPSKAGSAIMTLSGGMRNMELGLSTDILGGINAVEHAQCIEPEKRNFLCGIFLEYTQADGLRMVATDGRRLAITQLPGNGGGEDMSMTIPTEELEILKEALSQQTAAVSVEQIDGDMAAFHVGDVKKLVKLGSGTFADYRWVIKPLVSYTESVTVDRKASADLMEKLMKATEDSPAPNQMPSDWIQWDDTVYVSHASNILAGPGTIEGYKELCHTFLRFIADSSSPEELSSMILNHQPREEYERLLSEMEKRTAPPLEPLGKLKILDSEGENRFVGRFSSLFFCDAFNAMKGDTIKMRYRMEDHIPFDATMRPLLLEDGSDNIHVVMPMKV